MFINNYLPLILSNINKNKITAVFHWVGKKGFKYRIIGIFPFVVVTLFKNILHEYDS